MSMTATCDLSIAILQLHAPDAYISDMLIIGCDRSQRERFGANLSENKFACDRLCAAPCAYRLVHGISDVKKLYGTHAVHCKAESRAECPSKP